MQILWKSPALTYGHASDVAVTFWHQPINPEDMQALLNVTQLRAAKYGPHSVGLIIIMEPAALSRFDAESRRLNMQLFQMVKPVLRVAAGVVEGTGMWATTFRVAATTVNMATRVDVKVFATVESACQHVAEGMGLHAKTLQAEVEAVRQARASRSA